MPFFKKIAPLAAGALMLAASAVPGRAQQAAPWDMVYIGASWLLDTARYYGEGIEKDLGVDVQLWIRGQSRIAIATKQIEDSGWPILAEAKIVMVSLNETTSGRGFCVQESGEGEHPMDKSPEELRAEMDAFLAALTAKVDPEKAIIRIAYQAVLPAFRERWIKQGRLEECTASWLALDREWGAAAAQYGIPVVDVITAWNGPDGLGAPPEEYFVRDGGHLSEEGYRAVAELMQKMGYAPLAP